MITTVPAQTGGRSTRRQATIQATMGWIKSFSTTRRQTRRGCNRSVDFGDHHAGGNQGAWGGGTAQDRQKAFQHQGQRQPKAGDDQSDNGRDQQWIADKRGADPDSNAPWCLAWAVDLDQGNGHRELRAGGDHHADHTRHEAVIAESDAAQRNAHVAGVAECRAERLHRSVAKSGALASGNGHGNHEWNCDASAEGCEQAGVGEIGGLDMRHRLEHTAGSDR